MGLANSKALRLAQITEDLPDPEGGSLIRDENGSMFLSGVNVRTCLNVT
jgi:predicted amidohydrolase YtcJ